MGVLIGFISQSKDNRNDRNYDQIIIELNFYYRFETIKARKALKAVKEVLKLDINPKRIYGLDILRAAAISFVVFSHSSFLLPQKYIPITYYSLDGVTIFFVLSGFLIGNILIKILQAKGATFRNLLQFWIRRWFRTLPNYFLILSLLTLLNLLFIENFHFYKMKLFLVFSQNLFVLKSSFFPEAWSLSIEEWFYVLIPTILFFIIAVFKISIKNSILCTAFIVLIFITFFRYYCYFNPLNPQIEDVFSWQRSLLHLVFTRLDSLMYGIIGAYLSLYYLKIWGKLKSTLFIAGISLFIFEEIIEFSHVNNFYYCVFSVSLTSFATLLMLPYLSTFNKLKSYIFYPITYLSLISYSMYLVNLSLIKDWFFIRLKIISLLPPSPFPSWILLYILYWCLTILVSILIYKYFELPMMKLRDRINITNNTLGSKLKIKN